MKRIILPAAFLFFFLPVFCQVGKVGINTSTPAAMLHVKDSSVLFTSSSGFSVSPGHPPVSGPGNRMMWYADKRAFRTGGVLLNEWNKDSIGDYSFAAGFNVKATGYGAVAMGLYSSAQNDNAIALGSNSTASGNSSVAFGTGTTAAGLASTAMGNSTLTTGESSFAGGEATTAIGKNSFVTGQSLEARSYASVVIGRWNELNIGTSNPDNWVPADPVFMIGNGSSDNVRHNALTVLKNGNVGIGLAEPSVNLEVTGIVLTNHLQANTIQLFDGAAANRVLQSDANGNATWVNSTSLSINETDPKILSSTSNAVPRWNGVALVNGVMQDDAINIGIGTVPVAGNKLTVNGKTSTAGFQMSNGAVAGAVLQSDAGGNASWINSTSLTITETDPKILSAAVNYIPRWNGTALVNGIIQDDASNIGIGIAPLATNRVTVNGKLAATGFQLTGGAGNNRVLQSDAAGNASWVNSTTLSITENDPQVQSTTIDFVPRWNGTALVNGVIQDDATNIGIGIIPAAGSKLMVNGKTTTTNFQMTGGALNGYILRSDGSGNASWVSPSSITIPESDPSVQLSTVNSVPRWNGSSLVNGIIRDDGLGNVGIGVAPDISARLNVSGKTVTSSIQITAGAALNKVLVSDAVGNASWNNNLDIQAIDALDITTNFMRANFYQYQTPKTSYFSIPAAAFQLMPVNGTSTAGLSSTTISGGQTLVTGTAGVAAYFEAPVYLPANAIITGISLNVRDASGTYEVSAELVIVNTVLQSVLAVVPGTGNAASPGDTNIAVAGLNITVNELRNYFLRFNTIEFNGNLRVYNARITYTVDNVD